MITLLASLTGFISSILPEAIKYFKDHLDKKHYLKLIEKQNQIKNKNNLIYLTKLHNKHYIEMQSSLYKTYYSNIKFIDGLNASVRPVLAYGFFAIYLFVKYQQYQHINDIAAIWDIEDQAIFAGIISFYYGQRTFSRKI